MNITNFAPDSDVIKIDIGGYHIVISRENNKDVCVHIKDDDGPEFRMRLGQENAQDYNRIENDK